MNKQLKELSLSSMFLALAGLFSIFQIPINIAVSLDFSFVALLIGRRYIGYWKTIIICIIYPFFSLLGSGVFPAGVIFLILQSMFFITLDFLFCKDKYNFLSIVVIICLTTVILIVPLYFGLGFNSNEWEEYYNNIWENSLAWTILGVWFNPFKLIIMYLIAWPLWKSLKTIK